MRYASIDILRTIAIFLMVIVHFMENLSGADWAPAGFGAPLFTFLVGASYRLWLNAQEGKGKSDSEISKVTIRRGLFLFTLGFAFNIFVWLPEDTFNWDVLTLIGASLLMLNVVRNLPLPILVLIGIVAFMLAPMLRAPTDYPTYWTQGYFDPDLTLSDVMLGFLAVGYFPVFPWIMFPVAGFVTATLFFTDPPENGPPTARTAHFGAVLIVIAMIARLLRPHESDPVTTNVFKGWTMFPASLEYVTGMLGLTLLLFALGHRWIDRSPKFAERKGVLKFVGTFSKYSLSMYLLHHIVHLWPLWIYGAVMGTEPTQFWRNAISVWFAIPLSVLCLASCYWLFRWMDRTDRGGVESWMRSLCD